MFQPVTSRACDVMERWSAGVAVMMQTVMMMMITRSMTSLSTVVMVMTYLLFSLRQDVVEAISLAPVSWNRSNPM